MDVFPYRLFLLTCLPFLITGPWTPYPLSFLVKVLPLLFLIGQISWRKLVGFNRLLLLGLVFGMVGDIALEIDGQRLFVVGLGAFLIGHLFYIVRIFYGFCGTRSRGAWGMALGVAAFSGIMVGVLISRLRISHPDLLVPVLVYLATITVMAVGTCLRDGSQKPWPQALRWGGVLFLFSDALIAIDRFVWPLPVGVAGLAIMVTYYAAQYGIVVGLYEESAV